MIAQHNGGEVFSLRNVTRQFGSITALRNVSLAAADPSIIALIGKNGSGKTTLLRLITGLLLPTTGECKTLGVPTSKLGMKELSRLGVAHQREKFTNWMTVERMVRYVSTFHDRWDGALEKNLIVRLDLDSNAKVSSLSPGNAQRLGILLAVCHRPRLLLLDEPFSDLDPPGREEVLSILLELMRESEMTILVSSHLLFDVERIADRIVCLNRGEVAADASLDDLKERYAEWMVRARGAALPRSFPERFVLQAEGDDRQSLLIVRNPAENISEFRGKYGVEIEEHPLNLTKLFPFIVQGDNSRGEPGALVGSGPSL